MKNWETIFYIWLIILIISISFIKYKRESTKEKEFNSLVEHSFPWGESAYGNK